MNGVVGVSIISFHRQLGLDILNFRFTNFNTLYFSGKNS